MVPYTVPRKYTGELIGLEYLLNQTGLVLQDHKAAIEELETGDSDVQGEDDEGFVELVEFQGLTVPVVETALPLVGTFRPTPTPSTSTQSTAASVLCPPLLYGLLHHLGLCPPHLCSSVPCPTFLFGLTLLLNPWTINVLFKV